MTEKIDKKIIKKLDSKIINSITPFSDVSYKKKKEIDVFVGRENNLKSLTNSLHNTIFSDGSFGVSISGPGGCGKSTLFGYFMQFLNTQKIFLESYCRLKKEECEQYIDLLKQGYYKYITMNDRKDLILCLSNVVKFVRDSPHKSYLLYENSCCSEINPHVKKALRKAGAWNFILLGKRLKVVVPVSKRCNFDIQFKQFLENNNEFNKDMFVISEIILMQCKSHDVRC